MTAPASEIGRRGEAAAVQYLRDVGCEIVACNWRMGRYEIDIVARRFDELHFVEVKTRSVTDWTSPEDALDRRKCAALCRAVAHYLAWSGDTGDPRLDLAAVDLYPDGRLTVRYHPDAIELHW